ncbi:MAG: hypothetical protein IID53_10365, partial [Proteobacteria bacterium]|nr:hypothetical protein [Pseudomonadota bacterium]
MADHQTTSGENQGTQLAQAATDAAATGSAQGLKVTVAQCQADVLLDPPAAGERVVVKGEPGQSCCFDLASMEGSTVTLEGNTLMITLAGGGEIVLENFIPSAPGILPAAMCLADGTVIETADLILQSGSTMADVTPALGEIAPGAGVAPGAAPQHGGGAGFTPFNIDIPDFTPPPDPIDPTALFRTPPDPDPVSDPIDVSGVVVGEVPLEPPVVEPLSFIHDETAGVQDGPTPTDDDRGAGANPDNDDVGELSQNALAAAGAIESLFGGELSPIGQALSTLTVGDGESFAFDLQNDTDSGLTTGGSDSPILLSSFDDDTVFGFTSGEELVFIVFRDSDTGEVWFIQYQQINHDVANDFDEDNPEAGTDETVNLGYTVTNADGSTSSTVTVEIQDDGPVVTDENAGMLFETSIEGGETGFVGGTLDFDYGADDEGGITDIRFVSTFDPDAPGGTSSTLTSGGQTVVFGAAVVDGDDLVLTGTIDGGGTDIIEVRVDKITGQYTIELLGPIDHPDSDLEVGEGGEVGADDTLDRNFAVHST